MSEKSIKNLSRTLRAGIAVFALAAALAAISGCQSLAGTFGIATEQYVDDKLIEAEGRLETRINENRTKLEEYAATADKLEELIVSVENAVRTTDELKQLAVVLEDRLNHLPEETIRQLVEVLQQYLDAK